ncbi:sortase-dependent protein [Kitasatospora nipponensis]
MARQRLISGRTLAGAATLAVLSTGLLATAASAHTFDMTTTCSSVTIDLTSYQAKADNEVSLTLDGEKKLDKVKFDTAFHQVFTVPTDHPKPITAVLVVYTSDDPKGENHWSGTETKTLQVCPTPTPTPTPSPTTAPPSPSPSPSSVAPTTPAPTTAAPSTVAPASARPSSAAPTSAAPVVATSAVPKPSSTAPSLAFTGGGSNAGLIAGVGAAVLVVGGGLVYVGRRRPDGRH